VRDNEFNGLGPFGGAQPRQCQERRFMVSDDPALEGASGHRACAAWRSGPLDMHARQFSTLAQVVRRYTEAPHAVVGRSELSHRRRDDIGAPPAGRAPIELTDAEPADLVRFLGTLSADRPSVAAAPWTERTCCIWRVAGSSENV
jgi:hypothetical protein